MDNKDQIAKLLTEYKIKHKIIEKLSGYDYDVNKDNDINFERLFNDISYTTLVKLPYAYLSFKYILRIINHHFWPRYKFYIEIYDEIFDYDELIFALSTYKCKYIQLIKHNQHNIINFNICKLAIINEYDTFKNIHIFVQIKKLCILFESNYESLLKLFKNNNVVCLSTINLKYTSKINELLKISNVKNLICNGASLKDIDQNYEMDNLGLHWDINFYECIDYLNKLKINKIDFTKNIEFNIYDNLKNIIHENIYLSLNLAIIHRIDIIFNNKINYVDLHINCCRYL